jgi:cytochrome P450
VDNPLKAWPRALYQERFYRSRLMGRETVFVMAPDLIRAVLLDENDKFEKGELARRALRPALGESILVADGARWRWQRRAVTAIFKQEQIREFLPTMIAGAERTRDRWRSLSPGSEVDIAKEMMRTTCDIILSTMISIPSRFDLELFEDSITEYLESTSWVIALGMIRASRWVPYPGVYRKRHARDHLHQTLDALILDAHRRSPTTRTDLLSLLENATDPETGTSMSAIDVRNNLLTFITAGHETTALALTWSFYLLCLHPEVERRVKEEITAVTGGISVQAKHIDALTYTSQVIQEAMRLYPPAPLIVRAARRDVRLGNEQIREGTTVYVPIYAVHRHEKLWREPSRFDPTRFEPEATRARDRYTYLPFGAGQRVCIGQTFAQREATAVLATLLSSFQLRLRPGHYPEPRLRVTAHGRDADAHCILSIYLPMLALLDCLSNNSKCRDFITSNERRNR